MRHLSHHTPWVEYVAIVFMAIFFLVPAWGTKISWYVVLAFCLAYFGLSSFLFVQSSKTRWIIVGMFGLVLFTTFLFSVLAEPITIAPSSSGGFSLSFFISTLEQLFFSFFPVFLFYRMATSSSTSQERVLLLIVSVVILYVVTHSLLELAENPRLSRMNDVDMEIAQKNVANFDFVYALTGLIPVLTYCFFQIKSKMAKLLIVFSLIYLYYFIFKAQYTLSFLVSLIALFFVVYDNLPNNLIAKYLFWIVIFAIVINLPSIFTLLSTLVDSEDMVVRFDELGSFFDSGESEGDMQSRLVLYASAVNDFLDSPIIGNYHIGYNPHSTFLTWLAYTGIVGSLPLFYLYWKTPRLVLRFLHEKHSIAAYKAVVLTLILNGLTNPIHSNNSYAMIVFFISPLVLSHFSKTRVK